ncbi:MAG TPA: pyridoxamine 5'-phosphate oxidase family protein [Mycobacterium sp.]|uniref:pyridoxamine 5'-phosphate oxidase family protein n=1 Tax=Mycobacterium sp. TaxID=1785 RepID=UPI002B98FD83|nr:pyridoxamine 5'-phosphate oxidase family protein [Mycobacterium sp.]HME75595.1 pyridoxamine 5'-phosphate oxidase family protein [Mycobacterium sp.]
MGTKAAKQVDFERLAAALGEYRFAYLVTVDDDYRVHTVTVEPELHDGVLDVGLIGGRTRKNVESRSAVTLLWPPSEPAGYSLIVDGRAEVAEAADADDDTAALRVVPTRALLHRNADPNTPGSAKGCLHDCVVFSKR